MPQLYKACDAFVLPTRGEGWGLPVMEAMSMAMYDTDIEQIRLLMICI